MAEISPQIEIPNRALFKASEVCDLAKVQPYVLRSWEAEFKDLGVTKSGSSTRVYRRQDVERVLRIKHLLLIEGLTLAGARRKLEQEAELPLEMEPPAEAPGTVGLAAEDRERIIGVKNGLRSLLDLLDAPLRTSGLASGASGDEDVAPTEAVPEDLSLFPPDADSTPAAGKTTRRAATKAAGEDGTKSSSPRRKRSA